MAQLRCLAAAGAALLAASAALGADDILIADFEGDTYGRWEATGEAFGPGPARGTLPNQMRVSGFQGQGLVNSYYRGDGTTGTLTSPPFTIERPFINFLLGGGQHPGQTCINLLVAGEIVRTATGPNDRPGGTERLDWHSWDVSDLAGKTAQIRIVDQQTGGWGHINIDHIVQSDTKREVLIIADELYRETYRPQFHFTAQKNWHNDPNGLVYYEGEYHLFFQHNPESRDWGNMTWGHAVGSDLVHWTQLDHALHPDELGTIFSGSAVVDWQNTAGFQAGEEKVIVCIYTSAGGTSPESEGQPFTQSVAYSNDRGRTWTKFEGNPVLGHIAGSNRDPKVIWHEPTKKWVMALYLDENDFALFGSPDLKQWTRLCDVPMPGCSECPDFFELPVDGDPANTKWVFWAANGKYRLGSFDGTTFEPETEPLQSNWGANCYAAQTYSDIPASDGRRLQIAWMAKGEYPGMPFNQQMSFPVELALRTGPEGVRLCREPVREIETLHARRHSWVSETLKAGENPLEGLSGELFDIRAEIDLGAAEAVGFTLRGEKVHYGVADRTLSCLGKTAPLAPVDNRIRLQILLDRTTTEVFGNDGLISMPTCFLPDPSDTSLGAYAEGGEAWIVSLDVYELRSAWE